MATVSFPAESKSYTAQDLEDGKVEISKGSFIVKVKDGADDVNTQDAVLAAIKEALEWEPSMVMSSMNMFSGTLSHEQILWLLRREDIEFIEADGVVSICEK
eukprot:CAMPEP_0179122042 /NCGR_PEP_ID=MMETSP0796-20121207/57584_1 /TAXON_ID=73915 /ORGANISM="Pyrodinium bahamense, Strain pbaha01" /LENGTH=101 /DNA_ID=CAMNT_0020820657 /DNA_START=85 /DNA_END=390 /DNA_ORIENTATION=-